MTLEQEENFLDDHIPYRLRELSFCQLLCEFLGEYGPDHELNIHFGKIKGLSFPSLRSITNPVAETGLIMSRSMLEFLGIKASRGAGSPTLSERKKKGDVTDVVCENFDVDPIPLAALRKILAEQSTIPAEESMAATIVSASKGVAHLTLDTHPRLEIHRLAITCHTTNFLLNHYFYESLGLPHIELYKMNENANQTIQSTRYP